MDIPATGRASTTHVVTHATATCLYAYPREAYDGLESSSLLVQEKRKLAKDRPRHRIRTRTRPLLAPRKYPGTSYHGPSRIASIFSAPQRSGAIHVMEEQQRVTLEAGSER